MKGEAGGKGYGVCFAAFLQLKEKSRKLEGNRLISTPGRIRTLSLLIRSQTLYPVELRAHLNIEQGTPMGEH